MVKNHKTLLKNIYRSFIYELQIELVVYWMLFVEGNLHTKSLLYKQSKKSHIPIALGADGGMDRHNKL